MVSLWPFGRRDDSSAASFEKTLSHLSAKITRYTTQTEAFRSKQRRYKALWTLYTTFAYILTAAILTLVTGWDAWGAAEYTAVAGGPVAIIGVRYLLNAWYDYRVKNVQARAHDATKEREKVIAKLKAATKYDSTQQLLDKYGGGPSKSEQQQGQQQQGGQRGKSPKRKPSGRQSLPAHFGQQQGQQSSGPRTGFAPPPTANIPGRQPSPQNALDARLRSATTNSPPNPQQQPNESFAPNAFPNPTSPPQPPTYAPAAPAWYDRILDVVLGEDETSAKNRFALICASCRLVNGQAPPGARSLEDVGKWKCRDCGALNGVESEEGRVLAQARAGGRAALPVELSRPVAVEDEDEGEGGVKAESGSEGVGGESEELVDGVDTPPAGSTRSKARQRRKV